MVAIAHNPKTPGRPRLLSSRHGASDSQLLAAYRAVHALRIGIFILLGHCENHDSAPLSQSDLLVSRLKLDRMLDAIEMPAALLSKSTAYSGKAITRKRSA